MKKLKGALVSLMVLSLLVGSIGVFVANANVAGDDVAFGTYSTTNHEPKPLGT